LPRFTWLASVVERRQDYRRAVKNQALIYFDTLAKSFRPAPDFRNFSCFLALR
jgi:hypothetical protein